MKKLALFCSMLAICFAMLGTTITAQEVKEKASEKSSQKKGESSADNSNSNKATKEDAKEEEKKEDPKTLREINTLVAKKRGAALKILRGGKRDSPEYQEALKAYMAGADEFAEKIFELAKEEPESRYLQTLTQSLLRTNNQKIRNQTTELLLGMAKDDPESKTSFNNVMTVMQMGSPKLKKQAKELLETHYMKTEMMGDYAMSLTRSRPTDENVEMLRKLISDSEHKNVQGAATYALAKMLSKGEETREEGLKLLRTIPEKFADVKVYGGRRELAKMVAGEIFEAENLQIGMMVPDISGEDVDGVEFKLSDYKGKVVVIDFWGDW